MPSPKFRAQRRRHELTVEEIAELRLGPPEDRPSVFRGQRDLAEAAVQLAELDADRSTVALLVEEGHTLAEADRRHQFHFAYTDDPAAPATFLPLACSRCNPNGYTSVSARLRDGRLASHD